MSKVAIVLEQDYEDSEFRVPYDRLQEAGHEPTVLGTEAGKALSGKRGEDKMETDFKSTDVSAKDFAAVVIPGGYSPDRLRMDNATVSLVREIGEAGKPVAAICHGGSLLIEAGLVKERRVTSWPSIRTDLLNAGAEWVDEEVVIDGNLITSRKPDDLDAFCGALMERLS